MLISKRCWGWKWPCYSFSVPSFCIFKVWTGSVPAALLFCVPDFFTAPPLPPRWFCSCQPFCQIDPHHYPHFLSKELSAATPLCALKAPCLTGVYCFHFIFHTLSYPHLVNCNGFPTNWRSVALLLIKMPRRWYFRVAPCQSIIFHWPPSSFPEPATPQGNICQLSHQEFVQFVPELAISSNISSPIWAFLFIKKLIVNKISLKILPWKPGAPYVGKKAVTFCRLLALKLSRKIIAKVPGNDQWHAVWRETLAPFWNSLNPSRLFVPFFPRSIL